MVGAGRGAEAGGRGAMCPGRGTTSVSPHTLVHGIRGRGLGGGSQFLSFFLLSFLWRASYHLGTGPGRGQRGSYNVPPARGRSGQSVRRCSLDRLSADVIEQKKSFAIVHCSHGFRIAARCKCSPTLARCPCSATQRSVQASYASNRSPERHYNINITLVHLP